MLLFRAVVSALIVGLIAFGNTLQSAISTGQEPSKWQIYSAIIGGVMLALNDIKSRMTPATGEQVAVVMPPSPPPGTTVTVPVVHRP